MGFKIRSRRVERAAIWVNVGVNMPELNFNTCNLQMNSVSTNSKSEYKLSFLK